MGLLAIVTSPTDVRYRPPRSFRVSAGGHGGVAAAADEVSERTPRGESGHRHEPCTAAQLGGVRPALYRQSPPRRLQLALYDIGRGNHVERRRYPQYGKPRAKPVAGEVRSLPATGF